MKLKYNYTNNNLCHYDRKECSGVTDSIMEVENNVRNNDLKEFIDGIQDEKLKTYIVKRVLEQMQYFSKKSRECKKAYMCWMKVSIIIGMLIPIASIFANGGTFMKVVIAFLGAATAAISSYLNLQNFQKLWEQYRVNRELLLSLLYEYFMSSGCFKNKSDEDRNSLLVEKCEEVLGTEASSWRNIFDSNGQ